MKLDLTKTNGSSPPSGFLTQVQHLPAQIRADVLSVMHTDGMVAAQSLLKQFPADRWTRLDTQSEQLHYAKSTVSSAPAEVALKKALSDYPKGEL